MPRLLAAIGRIGEAMSERLHCSGVRTAGYWKGAACCALPKYRTADDRVWCKSHCPLGVPVKTLTVVKVKP
jgi:hypothetical protein